MRLAASVTDKDLDVKHDAGLDQTREQDPRNQLHFCISGSVQVECTEALYYDNPDIQNSVEIGDLADKTTTYVFVVLRTVCTV
jgi:hypothetical protein